MGVNLILCARTLCWVCVSGVLVQKKSHCVIWNERKKKNKALCHCFILRHCVWSHLVIFLDTPAALCGMPPMRVYGCDTIFRRMCDSQMDKCHVSRINQNNTLFTHRVVAKRLAWALQNCTFYFWSFQWTMSHEMALQSIYVCILHCTYFEAILNWIFQMARLTEHIE